MKGQRTCSLCSSSLVTSMLPALFLMTFTTDVASTRMRVVELSVFANLSTTMNYAISGGGNNGVIFSLGPYDFIIRIG